jgi:glutathione S-transferase
MKIYGDKQSGNCYKVMLACSFLQLDSQWIDLDILAGDTKEENFLHKNPNGKIPLLELSDGHLLWESNAIINFLADRTVLYPTDAWTRAKIHQWQFFEQYSHEPYIAVARFIQKYLGLPAERAEEYKAKQTGGHKALSVMEQQLRKTPFLVGEELSCADISLFAYTHVAHEGGFDLETYPAIQNWLQRVKATENFIAMPES